MQSMLHLTSSNGLPLCLCSIPPPLTLSKEMADHDRRRKAVKRLRSRARHRAAVLPEPAFWSEGADEITTAQGIADGDLADLFRDLSRRSFTAKAA